MIITLIMKKKILIFVLAAATVVSGMSCDNKKADHDGEHTVRTFFCVTR